MTGDLGHILTGHVSLQSGFVYSVWQMLDFFSVRGPLGESPL